MDRIAEKKEDAGQSTASLPRRTEFAEMDYLALYGMHDRVLSKAKEDASTNGIAEAEPEAVGELKTPPVFEEGAPPVSADWPSDLMDLLPARSSMISQTGDADATSAKPCLECPKTDSFTLGTESFSSAKEVAMAMSSDEAAWENGKKNLYPLLAWLETNDSAADVATFRGLLLSGDTPDFILFKFIHKKIRLSFVFGGKLIDIKQIYLCLKQVVTGKATAMERSLVSMLGNGQLLALHDEYLRLSSLEEDFMNRLLLFLREKPPSEQWVYLSALQKPEDYIWPKGSAVEEKETLLPLMISLGTLPLSKEYVSEVKRYGELPANVEGFLESPATYSIGALRLHDIQGRGALPAKLAVAPTSVEEEEFVGDVASHTPITTEPASVLFLERTPETLARIEDALKLVESVVAEVSKQNRPEVVIFLRSISGYFRQLRDRRLESDKELRFLAEVSQLKRRWDRHARSSLLFRLLALIGGGLLGWIATHSRVADVFGANPYVEYAVVFLLAISLYDLFGDIRARLLPRRPYVDERFSLVGAAFNLLPAWIALQVVDRFFAAYSVPMAVTTAAWAACFPLYGGIHSHSRNGLREELLTLLQSRYSAQDERLF